MTLTNIRPGDIIEGNVRGVRFLAVVEFKDRDGLSVEPICSCFTYRRLTARQVTEHWRGRRPRGQSA